MIDFEGKKTAVALGTFDGLHKGHLSVINKAVVQKNNGLLPVILLFTAHPMISLTGHAPKELFCGKIKQREIEKTGCIPVEINFEEIRNMLPEEFFSEILIKKLNAGFLSCGFNFRFGKNGSGNTEIIAELCEKYGVELSVADEVDYENECISSTRIRKALAAGDIRTANHMLGRFFSYDFEVVTGDRRGGAVLGIPTINQFFPENFVVPKFGVYASVTFAGGSWRPSMTNIGIRPTIGNSLPRSETNIFDFSGDLYGTNTEVALIEYVRPEKKFTSLGELKAQMQSDRDQVLKILKKEGLV